MHELNNLDLETITAGADKSGPDPKPGEPARPAAASNQPVTFRNRVIAVKKFFGLPPSLQEVGIPQLLPK